MMRPPRLLVFSAVLVAALALLPLGYLLIRSAGAGAEGWQLFLRPAIWRVFRNSAVLAIITTLLSVVLGVPLAWLTVRTDLPLRRFWSVMSILPLAMPSYIGAVAFIALLGPRGMVARLLEPLGVERLPEIYGLPGTVLVITLINYPFVVLSVRAALHRMDPAMEEAALGLGISRAAIFRRITLPQLRPSITAGGLLVALYALSDFGSPALMQYNTFTRVIYTRYSASFDRSAAALMALLLVVLTLLVLGIETMTRGRARYHRSASGAPRPGRILELGRWKWPAVAYCGLVSTASLGLPIFVLCYWTVVGLRQGQPLNLQLSPIMSSIVVSLLAALMAIAASLPLVFLAVRYRGRLVSLVDRAAYVGNALPGIVIALALVFFGTRLLAVRFGDLRPFYWLYQSMPMLIFAYVVRFLPQSTGCIRTGLLQIPPRLEEAARGLGHSRLSTFALVTFPLLLPGILAGGALVFLTTIKELPVTLLLSPPGFETLVSEIWWNASEGLFSQASPPALLMVGVSALSIMVILRQERRSGLGYSEP